MEDGRSDIAGRADQVGIAGQVRTGLQFLRLEGGHAGGGHQPPGMAQAVDGHLPVGRGGKIARRDGGRRPRIVAGDVNRARAFGPEIADRDGQPRKIVQRLAKTVQRQRLHMIFDIRGLERLGGFREDAQLAGRHRHRPASPQGVFQRDPGLAQQTARAVVQRLRAADPEHHPQLQMVLKVLAHAGQIVDRRDSQTRQPSGLTDAAEFQQRRRIDRACRQNDLGPDPGKALPAALGEDHARRAAAREGQAPHLGVGLDPQVGPAPHRVQKRLACVPSQAAPLGDGEITHAFVVATIEIRAGGQPHLLRGLGHGFQDRPSQPLLRDPHLAPVAVMVVGGAVVTFAAAKTGQHVVPAPAGVARLPPAVVIGGLPAHVDHAVDRGTAAQNPTARIVQAAAVQSRLGFGPVAPVETRIAHRMKIAHRHMDPEAVVMTARLQQQDAVSRIGGQAVGQHAARRSRADDDEIVVAEILHPLLLPPQR